MGGNRIYTLIGIFLIYTLFGISGCSKVYVNADIPCPNRPDLISIPDDIQLRMGEDAVWIVTQNQLALKEYAKKLEVRAGCR